MAIQQNDAQSVGAPDVELEGVSKRFGDHLAVDRLDLTIPRGAFFALLGPSGCGKTTTLRMVGGFEDPTEGRIRLSGADVTQLADAIGYDARIGRRFLGPELQSVHRLAAAAGAH